MNKSITNKKYFILCYKKRIIVMEKLNEVNVLTKECILTALLRLMEEKDYASISITDITNLAGVSRMAYYRNYKSKDEILLKRLEDEERKLISEVGYNGAVNDIKGLILYFALFYQENASVIKAVYSAGLAQVLSEMLEERIRSYFPIVDVTAQGRYAVHFYVGAIMASFKYWVDGEFEETAEQIAEIISNLIGKENAISLMVFPEN